MCHRTWPSVDRSAGERSSDWVPDWSEAVTPELIGGQPTQTWNVPAAPDTESVLAESSADSPVVYAVAGVGSTDEEPAGGDELGDQRAVEGLAGLVYA
jgi:hypothetical protein